MFENIVSIFKKLGKKEQNKKTQESSKDTAKERLHLVLMQDRANVSSDFLELMKQEIIDVIKKYIEVDEKEIDVRLTNKENEDGTNGAPALYANIPILNIKNETRKIEKKDIQEDKKQNEQQSIKENSKQNEQQNVKEKQNKEQDVKENKKQNEEQNIKENRMQNREEKRRDNKKECKQENETEEKKQKNLKNNIEEVQKQEDKIADSENNQAQDKQVNRREKVREKVKAE